MLHLLEIKCYSRLRMILSLLFLYANFSILVINLKSVRLLCLTWLFSSRGRKIPVELDKFIRSNPVHPVAVERLSICQSDRSMSTDMQAAPA